MKTKKIVILLLCESLFIIFSCSKEGPQGPVGEQGIVGDTGPRGATGAKGEKGDRGPMGNANVKKFVFKGEYDFTAKDKIAFQLKGLTQKEFEKMAWLVYLKYNSEYTYPIPGYGINGVTSYGIYNFLIYKKITIQRVEGPGEKYGGVIIFGIRANVFPTARQSAAWQNMTELEQAQALYPDIDFSNFQEVKRKFVL